MSGWKVLIVDDQPEITQNLENLLTRQGLEVKIAHNFVEGKFMVEHYQFEMAILDLFLPDGNGIDLYKLLKSKNTDIYTILITGNATIENAITALNEGLNAYLIKPFSDKQLEATLHQAEKTLSLKEENRSLFQEIQHNRQFYEDLLNSTSEAILVVDLDYRIQYGNQAAQELLKVSEEDFSKKFLHHYIEDGYKVLSHIRQQMVIGKAIAGYRVGLAVPDEKSFDAHLSADFLSDKNKNIEGLIINLTNPLIHDEVFNRILRKEKLSTIINIANALSHEIRNPINILSGRLQLLAEEMKGNNFSNAFETIQRQIVRILDITQLLGKFNLSREDSIPELCDINSIFQETLEEMKKQLKENKINLKISLDKISRFTEGNHAQFSDAFRYLFIALLDLIPQEQPLEIASKILKNYLNLQWFELQLKISGIRLSTEQLLNPYQTLDKEYNGLVGLGLTIMFIIFNNYGAKIESFIQNENHTMIRIRFPLKHQEEKISKHKKSPKK